MYKFIGNIRIFGIDFFVYNNSNSYLYVNTDRKIFKRIDL